MTRTIFTYGTAAGLIVGGICFLTTGLFHAAIPNTTVGMVIGYSGMLLAFTMIFAGVKRHRDVALGGVIGFWPALWLGLGITAIATLGYVLAWEAALAVTGMDYGLEYAREITAEARAAGRPAAEVASIEAEAMHFAVQYRQPLFRMMVTATEILPVGIVVSLIAAAVLRGPRARR